MWQVRRRKDVYEMAGNKINYYKGVYIGIFAFP
jgi:hypothetical protein